MNKQRLWVVSELYYPEQTSTGYFLTRIAEGLAGDFRVEAVCGQPTYSEHGRKAPAREQRHGVLIHRLRATRFGKDRLALRAVNVATFTLAAMLFAITRFRRGDRLLIVTNPPTLPPVLGLVARLRGVEAHLLVHDVYPEVLAATGHLKRDSLAYRMLDRISAATFRLYRQVIVLGRDMARIAEGKLGRSDVAIIPNWGDVDEVAPMPRAANPFAAAHRIAAPTVIQFSGNIGLTHDVEAVLAAAQALRDREDVLFLFVGFGGKTGAVAEAEASGAGRLRLLPRQPRELLGPMLACATATVISFVDDMKGLSVPSRMYNVLAAGTPIIALADPASELALTVAEHGAGWVLPAGDVEGLTRLVAWLATPEGREEAARRGAAGRAAVTAKFTLPVVLDRFREALGAAPTLTASRQRADARPAAAL